MKKYTLQTVTETGELVKESTLELTEGSILILQPKIEIAIDTLMMAHEIVSDALREGRDVLTIPEFIELKVLEVKE
jgi:hypothetical protein